MTDFRVGDRVRMGGGDPFVVEDAAEMVSGKQIIRFEGRRWWDESRFYTLVPPEKPKYRLVRHGSDLRAESDSKPVLMAFPPYMSGLDTQQMERALSAAMAAVGYEEEV